MRRLAPLHHLKQVIRADPESRENDRPLAERGHGLQRDEAEYQGDGKGDESGPCELAGAAPESLAGLGRDGESFSHSGSSFSGLVVGFSFGFGLRKVKAMATDDMLRDLLAEVRELRAEVAQLRALPA